MSLRNVMAINRGSDAVLGVQWYESDVPAAPVLDLTGFTAELYDMHPALDGQATITMPVPASGQTPIVITWSDDMPMGAIMHFRIRVSDGVRTSTEQIVLAVE